MTDVKVDREDRLYVIPCGRGYSCLGFEVAEERQRAVAEWMKQPCMMPDAASRGTEAGYASYEAAMRAGEAHAIRTGTRCPADLTQQLDGLEGKRVEVVDGHGERRRFYVGRSTGWFPVHLEISRRDSTGGPAVMGAPFASVRVVGGRR